MTSKATSLGPLGFSYVLGRLLRFSAKHRHYIISFVLQIALAGFFIHYWDGFVFITSASQFLQGDTPYQVAAQAPPYTFSNMIQSWYAYPPLPLLMFSASYAPYFFFLSPNPILSRIFIKLTFILGNLVCAYLVHKFVAGVSTEKIAAKAEKMVLYNPFLIVIAAVHGMFDIWIVNFLLLTLLSMRRQNFGRAGIYFGLCLLVKPIPAVMAPILLAHIWSKARTISKPIIFGSTAVVTFVLVSLPFFVTSPQGFFTQVVGTHLARPVGGWTPLSVLSGLAIGGEVDMFGFPLSSAAVSTLSLAMLALFSLAIFGYYLLVRERDEGQLLASLFLAMLVFTLFSKVVSIQFFVIPLVLAILVLMSYHQYKLIDIKYCRLYYKFLVIPFFLVALIIDFHFLTFIPSDIALSLFGMPVNEINSQIAASLPISPNVYQITPWIAAGVLSAPAVLMAIIITYKAFHRIIPAISKVASAFVLVRIKRAPRVIFAERALTAFLVVLLVGIPPAATVASQNLAGEEYIPPPPPVGDRLVGVFYYWWDNPSYDPENQYGDWIEVSLTPEDGYYGSTLGYVRGDIQQMRDAGIDFAIVPVPKYVERYFVFTQEAESAGFRFAPMVELAGLDTKDKINSMVNEALLMKDSPTFLKYEGKPVIFIKDDDGSLPEFWPDVKAEVEEKHGEVFWIGSWAGAVNGLQDYLQTFDAISIYSPASVWSSTGSPLQHWEQQAGLLSDISEGNNAPTIISVTPYFDDGQGTEIPLEVEEQYSYDLFWDVALENEPDMVLIAAWNEYQTSSAIEPTEEFGSLFLEKTESWCTSFHAGATE